MTGWVSGSGYDDARKRPRRVAGPDAIEVEVEVDWAEIYREFLPRVRSYVRGRVPAAWLDDTVQDTFARAYRSREHFDGTRPVWPWLATIARRACIETCRNHPIEVPFDVMLHGAVASDDPHAELERRLQAEAIGGALHLVSSRHRHLLVTYEVQGRAFGSLADDERISRQALKSALCRARDSFRTQYATLAERRGLVALPVVGPVLVRLRRWRRAFGVASLPVELAGVVVVGISATALFVGAPAGPHGHTTAVVVGAGADSLVVAVGEPSAAPAGGHESSRTRVEGAGAGTTPLAPPSREPGRPSVVRAAGGAGVAITPDSSTATIGVEWSSSELGGSLDVAVTLQCRSAIWEAACTVARATPNAE